MIFDYLELYYGGDNIEFSIHTIYKNKKVIVMKEIYRYLDIDTLLSFTSLYIDEDEIITYFLDKLKYYYQLSNHDANIYNIEIFRYQNAIIIYIYIK
jgi:hypothetical protein